jgi:hypothetical protein
VVDTLAPAFSFSAPADPAPTTGGLFGNSGDAPAFSFNAPPAGIGSAPATGGMFDSSDLPPTQPAAGGMFGTSTGFGATIDTTSTFSFDADASTTTVAPPAGSGGGMFGTTNDAPTFSFDAVANASPTNSEVPTFSFAPTGDDTTDPEPATADDAASLLTFYAGGGEDTAAAPSTGGRRMAKGKSRKPKGKGSLPQPAPAAVDSDAASGVQKTLFGGEPPAAAFSGFSFGGPTVPVGGFGGGTGFTEKSVFGQEEQSEEEDDDDDAANGSLVDYDEEDYSQDDGHQYGSESESNY